MSQAFSLFNKWKIIIPNFFLKANLELVKETYPIASHRPKVVFFNDQQTVSLAFNLTDNYIRPEQLEEFKTNVFEPQFHHPNIEILQSDIAPINGIKFILFSFIAPNIKYKLYNSFFITSCDGRLFIGALSCPATEHSIWQKKLELIFETLHLK